MNKKANEYQKNNGYIEVLYSNCNELFICDEETWDMVKDRTWHKNKNGYPCANVNGHPTLLHWIIMGKEKGYDIDHINGNKNDNRLSNLRKVTHQQNRCNSKLNSNNKSKFKGVCWSKASKKWMAYITFKSKRIYLGLYENIEDAKKARQNAEIVYFGQFRRKVSEINV